MLREMRMKDFDKILRGNDLSSLPFDLSTKSDTRRYLRGSIGQNLSVHTKHGKLTVFVFGRALDNPTKVLGSLCTKNELPYPK
ncbi:hypothetical protein VNO77_25580 [Canavalia gladiata]|uniref:Uncharacterized protein n=1 Tax=Canavalia gladiata TaxID=3824 RepID=A0AAN9LAV2_CANGL